MKLVGLYIVLNDMQVEGRRKKVGREKIWGVYICKKSEYSSNDKTRESHHSHANQEIDQ